MTDRTLFPDDRPDNDDRPDKLPHSRTDTSVAAAESMKAHAGQQRARIRQHFKERGTLGTTRQEVELALGIPGDSVRPRWNELVKAGEIKNAGTTRKTKSGRDAAVFVECSPFQRPAVGSKANWPTDGKSNPDKADSAEFVPDFTI